ncbi:MULTISPECIES: energy transducer TonB [Ferrimonas]|uniref:energy transducer TonB n=1 Tax=Ferrimonas TaxID=44011 RepID=UPI0003FE3512|nr:MULTISPECIES: energy transducer TonB [Ferrimonas]USD38318.1 energy transducer TonB [Ferrimonas sp. SCSIO 43195]
MILHHKWLPLGLAALLAMIINLLIFSLLPGLRTPPRSSDQLILARPISMVKLEPMKPATPPPPEQPKPQQAPPKPRLALPIDTTPIQTSSLSLKADPGLPELDTRIFKPTPGDLVFGEAQLDKPLIPTHNQSPIYPFQAKRMGLTGKVKVKFVVEKDGTVGEMEVVSATPPNVFDKATLDAVSRWTFRPGEITGEAVRVNVTQVINFNLNK